MVYTDIEMAILSQLAYQDMKEGETLWSALLSNKGYLEKELGSDYKSHISGLISKVKDNGCYIVKAQTNTSSGFSAFAVKDPINNNVVVACRGTELGKLTESPSTTAKDAYEDLSLALSKETMQQRDMANFMEQLQQGGYDEYSFTGHSLGGNLAMYGAITLKDKSKLGKCRTFNAPGYNQDFCKEYKDEIKEIKNKTDKNGNPRVVSYQNKYDGVSEALTVPGNVIIVDSKDKDRNGFSGHMLNDMVIENGNFKKSKKQRKCITLLGLILKYGGSAIDTTKENSDQLGSISRFHFASSGVFSANASGSNKIELSPAELKSQASQMLTLSNEYELLFNGVISDLKDVNGNWSPNLANNFSGKITSAQSKLHDIPDLIATGAGVATLAANSFESTDSLLTKIISVDSSKHDDGSIVGTLRDTVGKTTTL